MENTVIAFAIGIKLVSNPVNGGHRRNERELGTLANCLTVDTSKGIENGQVMNPKETNQERIGNLKNLVGRHHQSNKREIYYTRKCKPSN